MYFESLGACYIQKQKKKKMNAKYLIWGNENTLRDTCIISFWRFLVTKTIKRMNSTLFGET